MNSNIPPTLYDTVPDITIDMNRLKELIKLRYELLRKIEEYNNPSRMKTKPKEEKNTGCTDTQYKSILSQFNLKTKEGQKEDIASHFILSLAYCEVESERNWFSLQESRLFKDRIIKENYDAKKILEGLGIPLQEYRDITSTDLIKKIQFNQKNKSINKGDILFVPFEHALTLVPTHKYYINQGNVYLFKGDLINLIQTVFSDKINNTLNKIHRHYSQLMDDSRIRYVVEQFEREREAESFIKETEAAFTSEENALNTAKDVDIYASRTFPLCMYLIQKHINDYSHLMHNGRLQYILFLKGAGLPLKESIEFFKKKYEKKTPSDKFEKQYAYGIRHSYGEEGKRMDYPPYSCRKILFLNNPSSQECHGCPFKTYNDDNLKPILQQFKISESALEDIMAKKHNKEYPLACVKFFEARYPNGIYEKPGTHPNYYFVSAMKALRKKNKIEYEK